MRRQTILLMAVMGAALLLASGVALAKTIDCQSNRKCVGTRRPDTLFGTSDPDSIFGLERSDTPVGFGAADRLSGGSGNDQLWESDSNDVSNGDGADDKLSGGGGSDDYKFDDGWGDDTRIDKAIADNNTDTGNVVTFTSTSTTPGTLTINLVSDSGPLPEVSDATGDTINWNGNVIDNVFDGHQSNDSITGNDRANEIISVASFDNDTISSAGGDDTINVQDGPGSDRVE